jgi:hypothetical protein
VVDDDLFHVLPGLTVLDVRRAGGLSGQQLPAGLGVILWTGQRRAATMAASIRARICSSLVGVSEAIGPVVPCQNGNS